jgi:hypothetical protein
MKGKASPSGYLSRLKSTLHSFALQPQFSNPSSDDTSTPQATAQAAKPSINEHPRTLSIVLKAGRHSKILFRFRSSLAPWIIRRSVVRIRSLCLLSRRAIKTSPCGKMIIVRKVYSLFSKWKLTRGNQQRLVGVRPRMETDVRS